MKIEKESSTELEQDYTMEIIMEQFLKEKKPVIKLLNYSILMMSSIFFFSSATREEQEIK